MVLAPEPAPISVTALNEQVRAALLPLRELRVQGEVSGARFSSGHLYFDLKDATSKVRVTVWRTTLQRLRLEVRDGLQVVVTGRVDVWVQGGTYALSATNVEQAGQGALWVALQRLKEKLTAEGLFDPSRKVPLPFLPKAVGIVTSPTGAALRDMLRILRDRYPVRVVVAPAKVQGEGAAESIALGIEALDRSGLVDVIIAGRGGGSIEDLWAFHEERVVRAVAACKTPIVSAVGHEVDHLLSDLAADVRAPTPTAAAELVVPRRTDLQQRVVQAQRRMAQSLRRHLTAERRHLVQLQARLGDGGDLTGQRLMRVDDARRRLGHAMARLTFTLRRRADQLRQRLHQAHPLRRLAMQRGKLHVLHERLLAQGRRLVPKRQEQLDRRVAVLRALDPRAALQRGYGIVRRTDNGQALQQVAGVQPGTAVEVLLRDGSLDCRVEEVRPLAEPGQ